MPCVSFLLYFHSFFFLMFFTLPISLRDEWVSLLLQAQGSANLGYGLLSSF